MMKIVLQIPTFKAIEEIQLYHDLPPASLDEMQKFLDEHCFSTFFNTNTNSLRIRILDPSQESPWPAVTSPSAST